MRAFYQKRTVKAKLLKQCFVLHLVTSSERVPYDRKLTQGLYSLTRSDKYNGAVARIQLK